MILQDKTGKRDQKVYTFKRNEYQTVSLDYHSAFGVTLSPIQAILTNSAGSGTFVLYYEQLDIQIFLKFFLKTLDLNDIQ